jgi:hypothetical protein
MPNIDNIYGESHAPYILPKNLILLVILIIPGIVVIIVIENYMLEY